MARRSSLPPESASRHILVTGGAGYLGGALCLRLAARGWAVRAFDSLLHAQQGVADRLREGGVAVVEGDVRDAGARSAALEGITDVVHLAAVVGDPACARDPVRAHEVNVISSRALVDEARAANVERFVFASTCSNYGLMGDPSEPAGEDAPLAPVSMYARQKVGLEEHLLAGGATRMGATCLRFATVFGVAPRMRFDLTVNEFTRDLWAGRRLEVFGEGAWRPYVHVEDAGRAVETVLAAPRDLVAGRVFNVGSSTQNFTKRDLVETIDTVVPGGDVVFVDRGVDTRNYRVAFERIEQQLGYRTTLTVDDGIAEIVASLGVPIWADPWDERHRNTP